MEQLEGLKSLYEKGDKSGALHLLQGLEEVNVEYYGDPLLNFVVSYCDVNGVEYLLDKGYDVKKLDSCENSALHALARVGYTTKQYRQKDVEECTKLLIEAGVSTLRKNENGDTIATLAAFSKNLGVIKVLISMNKKIDALNKRGNSPLYVACSTAKDSADSFYKYDVDKIEKEKQDLMVKKEQFGEDSPAYKVFNSNYEKSLMNFEKKKKELESVYEIISRLIENGLDPDSKGENQKTPREIAQECIDTKLASIVNGMENIEGDDLLSKGLSISQAIINNDIEALQACINLGNDVNELYDDESFQSGLELDGLTPLSIACLFMNEEAVKILIDAGADINYKDQYNKHALAYCFTQTARSKVTQIKINNQSFIKIFDAFINKGFDVNEIIDEEGNTILNLACKILAVETALNSYTTSGTAIQIAMKNRCNPDIADYNGVTPLMRLSVCSVRQAENLLLDILESDADISLKDNKGNTALMYCANNRDFGLSKTMCEYLFDIGDPLMDSLNNSQESAMDIALKNDNQELVQLLIMKG
ncbi:MAG: ankyrin repeat domain-containing protein [Coprobacillaceae bacterium]